MLKKGNILFAATLAFTIILIAIASNLKAIKNHSDTDFDNVEKDFDFENIKYVKLINIDNGSIEISDAQTSHVKYYKYSQYHLEVSKKQDTLLIVGEENSYNTSVNLKLTKQVQLVYTSNCILNFSGMDTFSNNFENMNWILDNTVFRFSEANLPNSSKTQFGKHHFTCIKNSKIYFTADADIQLLDVDLKDRSSFNINENAIVKLDSIQVKLDDNSQIDLPGYWYNKLK